MSSDRAGNPVKTSNSEIKRWLNSKSVLINRKAPLTNEDIKFPITQLVFFPKGKRKTTYV